MANSYVSNHVHIVFRTKDHLNIIRPELQPELWAYLGGIAQNHGMQARAIGGMEDHVHALLDVGPVLCIAKAAQVLKANSSRWMNERCKLRFEWQEGYFACSVSPFASRHRSELHREPGGTSSQTKFQPGVRTPVKAA
jgi:putative transposase